MSRTQIEGRAERLLGLASILQFVASFFFNGPSPELDRLLSDDEWLKSLLEAGLVGKEAAENMEILTPEAHANAFFHLFRVPRKGESLPPYEQTYLKERVTDPRATPAVACKLIYEQAGYDMSPYENIPADFLGHQARFLSEVLKKEADAISKGDHEGADNAKSWRVGFLSEHCLWWERFSSDIKEKQNARQFLIISDLIRSLVRLLENEL